MKAAYVAANLAAFRVLPDLNVEFEYDIVVSFAGENRAIVEEFANLMRQRGLSVFYDEWNKAQLWGKDLYQYLHDIYSTKARFCVIFISAEYAAKAWTDHELRAAQSRAFAEKKEYILPVRLDDTAIPGLPTTIGFLDLRKMQVHELVEIAVEKVRSESRAFAPKAEKRRGQGRAISAAARASGPIIDNSREWTLLDNEFYRTQSVERPDEKRFVVSLVISDPTCNGQLEALRADRSTAHRHISFAYANEACFLRLESAASKYEGGDHHWSFVLLKDEYDYGHGLNSGFSDGTRHYSADDFARMRANRILLGDAGAPITKGGKTLDVSGGLVESFIRGNSSHLKVTESPIQQLARKMPRRDTTFFLTYARLLCLLSLRVGGVAERIDRLALGPLAPHSVHVSFRGWRRENQGAERQIVEVEGECPLPRYEAALTPIS